MNIPHGVVNKTWRYALIGGVVSIPLTISLYWYSGMGNDFSLNMVTVGGLLAGYLAKRDSVDAKPVGLRAGLIGTLPGLAWILPQAVGNVAAGWSVLPIVILVVLFSVIVVGIGALAGVIGGAVGGWLATKIGDQQIPVSGA
jgi:hypothetical protein